PHITARSRRLSAGVQTVPPNVVTSTPPLGIPAMAPPAGSQAPAGGPRYTAPPVVPSSGMSPRTKLIAGLVVLAIVGAIIGKAVQHKPTPVEEAEARGQLAAVSDDDLGKAY